MILQCQYVHFLLKQTCCLGQKNRSSTFFPTPDPQSMAFCRREDVLAIGKAWSKTSP